MVGFCHGGNMPASHDDHPHDDDDAGHLGDRPSRESTSPCPGDADTKGVQGFQHSLSS